jgi:hypothetical protein
MTNYDMNISSTRALSAAVSAIASLATCITRAAI